jgi:hypothetical protein
MPGAAPSFTTHGRIVIKANPSGVEKDLALFRTEISLIAALAAVFITGAASAETIPTRYGTLSAEMGGTLLLNGRPVATRLEVNNGVSLVRKFALPDADVVVIENAGGTGCPAQYWVVTVSRQGAVAPHEFGTCSDLAVVSQEGAAVVLTMPGFLAHTNSAAIERAARQKHVFRVQGASVTDNGKPI